jgi:hypothetical protein
MSTTRAIGRVHHVNDTALLWVNGFHSTYICNIAQRVPQCHTPRKALKEQRVEIPHISKHVDTPLFFAKS